MAETTIEWTDRSISPVRARDRATGKVFHWCKKVSPGCLNCYAEKMALRFGLHEYVERNRDKIEFFLDEEKLREVLRRKKPCTWFWEDCSDLFGSWVPDEWIDRCFATMALTPQHTHQVLTKRPERMAYYWNGWANPQCARCSDYGQRCIHRARYVADRVAMACGAMGFSLGAAAEVNAAMMRLPIPNIWLGVSVEDQQRADERIPLLLQIPAAVRFLSVEPLLGPIQLPINCHPCSPGDPSACQVGPPCLCQELHWVIVGSESGPRRRPMHQVWAESIQAQCQAAGITFFVKQMEIDGKVSGDIGRFPQNLQIREFPEPAR